MNPLHCRFRLARNSRGISCEFGSVVDGDARAALPWENRWAVHLLMFSQFWLVPAAGGRSGHVLPYISFGPTPSKRAKKQLEDDDVHATVQVYYLTPSFCSV